MGRRESVSLTDWARAQDAPSLWPVEGPITGPFGARIDPFNGEGAFHRGIDISAPYGQPIVAPADGVVTYADFINGYGRTVILDHGNGIVTRYAHLSAFSVTEGQHLSRGERLGYVGPQRTIDRLPSSLRSLGSQHSRQSL